MKIIYIAIFLWLALVAFRPAGQAQDAHFSQYGQALLYTNPALTGYMQGDLRLLAMYRNQWNSVLKEAAYRHALAVFDIRWCMVDQGNNYNFLSAGLLARRSWAGTSQFINDQAALSIAYHQQLGDIYLAGGATAGIWQYQIDPHGLQFEEQFDGKGYNPSFDHLEDFEHFRNIEPDISAGLLLYDTKNEWSLGLALHHVNKPTYSFLEKDNNANRAGMGITAHGTVGFIKNRSRERTLFLSFLYRRQSIFGEGLQWELFPGGRYRLPVGQDWIRVTASLHTRLGGRQDNGVLTLDAFIPGLHFNTNSGWGFGMSYDINVSPLRKASKLGGALEVSLQWQLGPGGKRGGCVACPEP